MKKLNGAIKNAPAFLMAGLLFFSCALGGTEDYGTLLIILPVNRADIGGRAAVSGGFTSTLSYRLDCSGPGGDITEHFNSGARAAVSLSPGNWTVTVSALNAAGEIIGSSGSVTAAITAGKTTSIPMSIFIDTSRNSITSFAATRPVSAKGIISPDTNTIEVYVPGGTGTTNMDFTLIHTGASISPSPGTPLDFSSSKTFTVTAEDSSTQSYTVRVIPLAGGTGAWPSGTTWETYGLAELTQPEGTTVDAVDETADEVFFGAITVINELSVTLRGTINDTAYEGLKTQITTKLDSPDFSQNSGGIRVDKFEKELTMLFVPYAVIRVMLDMNAGNGEIIIRADRKVPGMSAPDWW
jgi:hypothetical protein